MVVSGASGGVGSVAVILLSRLGYKVSAVSRAAAADYLKSLGASNILSREEMAADSRPLEAARWDAAVDCVGGKVLARLLAETKYGGVVAACGLAGSHQLSTTVMPFILRGVRLDGIDSVMIPLSLRQRAWDLLSTHMNNDDCERIIGNTIPLADVTTSCERLLTGELNGRFLVQL